MRQWRVGGGERWEALVARAKDEAAWEAGEIVGSERMRAMDGDGQRQMRSGRAPMPRFFLRLRPVSLLLILNPDDMRSIFLRRRRYRHCLPESPSESG